MFKYISKRLGIIIITFLGVTLFTFILIHNLPGDVVQILAGERGVNASYAAELRAKLGLNQPLYIQYLYYVWNVLHGDLGKSFVSQKPVISEFLELFPATFELATFAMLFAIILGIPLGIISAIYNGKILDQIFMSVSLVGFSMPIFWWGLMLIILFSLTLGLTPVGDRLDLTFMVTRHTGIMVIDTLIALDFKAFASALKHLILPSVVLGTIPLAMISRMTRSSMLEVMNEPYIMAAKARGISSFRITWLHTLRNALIQIVTVIGLQTSILLTGAILTETIFSWPGIGKWIIESVARRDYPVIQGGILLTSFLIILVNMSVDMLYVIINPRIRK